MLPSWEEKLLPASCSDRVSATPCTRRAVCGCVSSVTHLVSGLTLAQTCLCLSALSLCYWGAISWGFWANAALLLHGASEAETALRVKNWVCCSPTGRWMWGRTGFGRGTECEFSLGGTPGLVPLLLPGKNPSLGYIPLLPPSSDTRTQSQKL